MSRVPRGYRALRSLLFKVPPESIHGISLQAMRLVGALPLARTLVGRAFESPSLPVNAFGLRFSNPVGLAAGYDKDALGVAGLASLGFGHVEVGTVTLRPQAGNPPPRVFRLSEDRCLINRLGFPSKGADFVERRLRGPRPPGLIVGVNIGKNRDTPLEDAPRDYLALMDRFAPLADYLVVNVSSPNTVGLRRLQARASLDTLLQALMARRAELTRPVPLLVKLSPDLDDDALDDALGALLDHGVDGVVATNTTVARDGLRSVHQAEKGGLSGAALTRKSTAMVAAISRRTQQRLPIIGVGGIFDADDARAKLDAGATLVQLYTGMIYQGPGIVRQILSNL